MREWGIGLGGTAVKLIYYKIQSGDGRGSPGRIPGFGNEEQPGHILEEPKIQKINLNYL